jgi:hypothetical protein
MLKAIESTLNKLRENGEDVQVWGRVPESSIRSAEINLNISLPAELNSIISELGGFGVVGGPWFCGIMAREPLSDNVFTLTGATKYCRDSNRLAPWFAVVRLEPDDLIVAVDTRERSQRSPVYSVDPRDGERATKLASSLEAYLLEIFFVE